MKVFLSHKMNGLTEEEIVKIRKQMEEEVKKLYPHEKIEILDSYFKDVRFEDIKDSKNVAVWCLGNAIKVLSKADMAYFARDYEKTRGCLTEHLICVRYDIPIKYQR